MKKNILPLFVLIFGLLISFNVYAAAPLDIVDVCSSASMKSLEGIINWGTCLLSKSVVPFLFALAVVAFIWGVIQFYLNPNNEEKRKNGKNFIIGGVIALFVMVSVWGLVYILTSTFKTKSNNSAPAFPQVGTK